MRAFQCDRCFKYYTANKEVSIPGQASDVMAARIAVMGPDTQASIVKEKRYELCDDCMKKVVNFLTYKSEL